MTKDGPPGTPANGGEGAEGIALWNAMRVIQGGGERRQLGTRISAESFDLLQQVVNATNFKQFQLLEFAILRTFGTEEGRKLWQEK